MTSILIVEDDNDINNLICNTLKAEGYQRESAFDGKEGADKIEQNRYDFLLLDIMLPEINGYELQTISDRGVACESGNRIKAHSAHGRASGNRGCGYRSKITYGDKGR